MATAARPPAGAMRAFAAPVDEALAELPVANVPPVVAVPVVEPAPFDALVDIVDAVWVPEMEAEMED
jgi:hypothetical protein